MKDEGSQATFEYRSKFVVPSCQTPPDRGPSPSSSWPDTLPLGMKSASEVDCAGAVGLAAGRGPAFSRVLPCCLSFCLESSCGILRAPIGPLGTGAPCCCDAGEDRRAVSQGKRFAHNQKKKNYGTL